LEGVDDNEKEGMTDIKGRYDSDDCEIDWDVNRK
jgi:hypothetical protein